MRWALLSMKVWMSGSLMGFGLGGFGSQSSSAYLRRKLVDLDPLDLKAEIEGRRRSRARTEANPMIRTQVLLEMRS